MRILSTRVYRGPNVYGLRPMLRLEIDLEGLDSWRTNRAFAERLAVWLPGLHHDAAFDAALREGLALDALLAWLGVEIQRSVGAHVDAHAAENAGGTASYAVFEYEHEDVGREAGYLARDVIEALLPDNLPGGMDAEARASFNFHDELMRIADKHRHSALGPSTSGLVRAAEARGIPWTRLNDVSLVQLGYGRYQKRIEATITSHTGTIAVSIAQDKDLTTRLLRDAGLPVPRNVLVETEDEALDAADDLGFPVVTKPFDGNHGRGVSINLNSDDEVILGFRVANEESRRVIVEQFLTGHDYRILVINGKVAAVAQRVPGHVVGDGRHTIAELVEITNRDPRRGEGHEKNLTYIELDHQALRLIDKAEYTPESVLPAGNVLYLRLTGNLSTGGTAVDFTDDIHPDNARAAIRAVLTIGLDVGGVDMIAPDIRRSVFETGGAASWKSTPRRASVCTRHRARARRATWGRW